MLGGEMPAVPHKAVAEVSKIGALLERLSWSVDDRVTGGWSVDV